MKGPIAIAMLVAALVAGPASAAELPKGGLTIEEMQTWLRDAGYKADLKTEDDTSRIASATEGVNFDVYMYDCAKDKRCASLQFRAGFDLTEAMAPAKANEWNTKKRYAKVYLDDESDPYLEYDANLSPGGTYEALKDDFGVWQNMISEFKDFIDW